MQDRVVVCHDINGVEETVSADELQFRPSVYGVILRGDAVLLSKQWDGYDFPGGGIHKGERIAEALVREVREETGLDVAPGTLIHVSEDFFVSIESRKKLQSYLFYYTASVIGGEISTDFLTDHEKRYMERAQWVPLSDIESLKFYNPVDGVALIRQAARLTREG